MALPRNSLVLIVGYYFIALLPIVVGLPALVATLLAAPHFVLLPLGLGLFLMGVLSARVPATLTRMQVMLLGYLIGAFVLVQVYVLAERYGFLAGNATRIFTVVYVLSLFGYLRFRAVFVMDAPANQALRLFILIALPLLGFRYLTQIGDFAHFPILDLFQRVHFHKGALEFARFEILNPFVADSYIPFQQVHLGLLAKFFGFEPLLGEWVLPLVTEPLRFASYAVIVMRLNTTPFSKILGLSLCLAWMSSNNPTNGEIVSIAVLLMLSFLIPNKPQGDRRFGLAGVLAIAMTLALMVMGSIWLYSQSLWIPFVLLLLLVPLTWRWANECQAATGLLVTAIVMLIILPFHRSSTMLLGFVLVSVLVLGVVNYYLRSERNESRSKQVLAITILLGIFAAVMAGMVLSQIGLGRHDEFGLWPLFDTVMRAVLGKNIYGEDVLPGLGGKTALFELGRSISVVVVGLVAFFLGRYFLEAFFAKAPLSAQPQRSSDYKPVLDILVLALFLMVLILTGFPFIHRAAFLPAVFVNIALAEMIGRYFQRSGGAGVRSLYGVGLATGFFILIFFLFTQPALLQNAKPYLNEVAPELLGLIALVLTIIFWKRTVSKSRILLLVLVIAVLTERTFVTALFRSYAYNHTVPAAGQPISHFDMEELAMADWVAETALADVILLSDPYTLSLVRARTGLNGAVTYSNLDTLPPKNKEKLLRVLSLLADKAESTEVCNAITEMLVGGSSPELNYVLSVQQKKEKTGWKVLRDFGYRNTLTVSGKTASVDPSKKAVESGDHDYLHSVKRLQGLRFQVIWTARTNQWLTDNAQGNHYFPVMEPLSESLKAGFISKYAPVHLWPRAATFQLNCR